MISEEYDNQDDAHKATKPKGFIQRYRLSLFLILCLHIFDCRLTTPYQEDVGNLQ